MVVCEIWVLLNSPDCAVKQHPSIDVVFLVSNLQFLDYIAGNRDGDYTQTEWGCRHYFSVSLGGPTSRHARPSVFLGRDAGHPCGKLKSKKIYTLFLRSNLDTQSKVLPFLTGLSRTSYCLLWPNLKFMSQSFKIISSWWCVYDSPSAAFPAQSYKYWHNCSAFHHRKDF